MKNLYLLLAGFGTAAWVSSAAILTVTTTNNLSPGAGETSLAQALTRAAEGDEIRFNLAGPGPHYLVTPPTGYPTITKNNLTINGYSQPGSSPNTNSILAPNTAKLKIVLDSRTGGRTVLDMDGYGTSESAILGVVGASNVAVRGLGFLGKITEGSEADPALYCVSFAAKATGGQVSGCWMGVDMDGTSVFGANAGVTGFRFRDNGDFLSDNIVVGVATSATNAPAQFNVIVGMKLPVIIEGQNLRVAGNFLGVLPSGTNDYNNALAGWPNEGAIQVGRNGGGTVIGTDGDGVNDAQERNVFGGVIPRTIDPVNGYTHTIEFYGGGPRNNVVVAGNYFGVGIDGQTRFTNGVPILSGQTGSARIGSDFDGISDDLEGNVIFNNYPSSLFPPDKQIRDFLDGAGVDAILSVRGNKLINNFAPPVSPLRNDGAFITNYYAKALLDPTLGLAPRLATNSSTARLIGAAPIADTNSYPVTIIDLYLPDPEGLTNALPEFPDGSIQGATYLGSFVEGSKADLNAKPGEFEFEISRLNLPAGAKLTATANFSPSPAGTHNALTLTSPFSKIISALAAPLTASPIAFSRAGNRVTLTWTDSRFILQSATSVTGPWKNETTGVSSFAADLIGLTRFFRLISP